ncbi:protein ESMERALDA 1-like [Helianthus annuus]|uniref:protein ESMERALDA 1-like n=1 Tax=Helianthus annuus TaxID=4232 RepID=UPI000B8FA8B7|nr:protein ESMERALDA 1-like [Helianthus annuus]
MALSGKLIGYVEISKNGDFFHDLFRHNPHKMFAIAPDRAHDCELHEGDRGAVGSVITWHYTEGGKRKISKQIIEYANEENHMIVFNVIGGELAEIYKSFKITLHVEPKGDGKVGLMLRGMGFGKHTSIFLASGKIYDSERYMAPLLEMFPLLQTKEMLASAEELAPFKNYSSRMAAIDYTVCLHSEVFVTTQGGNFPHLLLGHRRYLFNGHSKTIKPDKRKLAVYFDNPKIGWKTFKRHMLSMRAHSDAKGIELKRPNDSIYSFPCPNCMCRTNKTDDSRKTPKP